MATSATSEFSLGDGEVTTRFRKPGNQNMLLTSAFKCHRKYERTRLPDASSFYDGGQTHWPFTGPKKASQIIQIETVDINQIYHYESALQSYFQEDSSSVG
jgi:hypothetical protein